MFDVSKSYYTYLVHITSKHYHALIEIEPIKAFIMLVLFNYFIITTHIIKISLNVTTWYIYFIIM